MKKKIVFVMMLIMSLTGGYICTTNAASAPGDERPIITAAPRNIVVKVGQKFRIDAVATGTKLEARWYKNNIRIRDDIRITQTFDGERASLRFSKAEISDTGTYRIVFENEIGMADANCEVYVESLQ